MEQTEELSESSGSRDSVRQVVDTFIKSSRLLFFFKVIWKVCVCGQTIFPEGGADSIQSDLDSPALKYLLNGEKRPQEGACRGSEHAEQPSFVCSLLLLIKEPRSRRAT